MYKTKNKSLATAENANAKSSTSETTDGIALINDNIPQKADTVNGINDLESAAYNVAVTRKRGIPSSGPSSAMRDGGALNGDTSQGKVYHDKSQLSSENKTEMQLAYERALAKSNGNEQYFFASQKDIDSAMADVEAHYGDIVKRGNLRNGPSSAMRDGGALNGDTSQGKVYHDKSQLSSENKTEMQLAYERALAKSNGKEKYSFVSPNYDIPDASENGHMNMTDDEFGKLLNKRTRTRKENLVFAVPVCAPFC